MRELMVDSYGVATHRVVVYRPYIDFPPSPSASLPDELTGLDKGSPIVLFVGRLVPQKGLGVLYRALSQLRREGLRLQLVVTGTGDGGESVPPFRPADDPSDSMYCGQVERARLAAIYGMAATVVVPSLYEPYGLVCREAMACGCPVVASAVDGLKEAVDHGRDGLLVPLAERGAERYIESSSLADALRRVLTDPALAKRLARNARAKCSVLWGNPGTIEVLIDAVEEVARS